MTKAKHTHDELQPIHVGLVVHVVDGQHDCTSGVVTEPPVDARSFSALAIDDTVRHFDRAGAFGQGITGSWHFADHGEWRDA